MALKTYALCINCTRSCINSFKIVNEVSKKSIILYKFSGTRHSFLNRNYFSTNSQVSTAPITCHVQSDNENTDSVKDLKDVAIHPDLKSRELKLQDVSDYAPAYVPSFNFAAYINNSPTLQEFVKLNVDLHKLEKHKEVAEFVLGLDFEKNVKQYITFLHDIGVPADQLGHFITNNPLIFREDLENLHVRVSYLLSKNFTQENITRIITKNPKWLSFNTKLIDSRLGYFQSEFKLKGNEVRYLAVKCPKLITYNFSLVKINTFSFKEEMGFSLAEMKKLLIDKPKLFSSSKNHVLERFNYVHNIMKIDHGLISSQPEVLMCRLFRIKQRDQFLKSIRRDQYNPNEPGYVSLIALVSGTDTEFCRDVAKMSIATFNVFLKTR